MKKNLIKLFKLHLVTFFIACWLGNAESHAQSENDMFQIQSTFNIGNNVNAVEFLKYTTDPLIAIGTQNESNGSLEIRNVLTGKIVKNINTNGAVFKISSSTIGNFIAVGTIYGAKVYDMVNNKTIYLQTPGRGRITDIYFDDIDSTNTEVIVGDQDGNISFFKFDSSASYLKPYKILNYPVNKKDPGMKNRNPTVRNFSLWNKKLTAGYLNQIVSWDTSDWDLEFQNYETPGANGYGRMPILIDVAANGSDFIFSADSNVLQAINYNGKQKYQIPFIDGDTPLDICFGAFNFPFVAISTSYDKCLVYKVEESTANLIGNFSDHTFTVSSVDIRSYNPAGFFMATGSGDKTVEIWKYNENYKP